MESMVSALLPCVGWSHNTVGIHLQLHTEFKIKTSIAHLSHPPVKSDLIGEVVSRQLASSSKEQRQSNL